MHFSRCTFLIVSIDTILFRGNYDNDPQFITICTCVFRIIARLKKERKKEREKCEDITIQNSLSWRATRRRGELSKRERAKRESRIEKGARGSEEEISRGLFARDIALIAFSLMEKIRNAFVRNARFVFPA